MFTAVNCACHECRMLLRRSFVAFVEFVALIGIGIEIEIEIAEKQNVHCTTTSSKLLNVCLQHTARIQVRPFIPINHLQFCQAMWPFFFLLQICETHHWDALHELQGQQRLSPQPEDIMTHFTKKKLRIFGDVGNCMVFKNE